MTRRGLVLFVAMGVIWGLPYLFIRIAVRELSPAQLVFFRASAAAVVLAPYVLWRWRVRELRGHLVALGAYTLVELALPWLLLFRGEQRLPSSVSGMLVSLSPVFALVLTRSTRHEDRLGLVRLAGLACGIGGTVVLVGTDVHGAGLIGVAEIVGVAACYATGPFVVSRHLRDLPAPLVVFASLVATALLDAPFALRHLPSHLAGETYESLGVLVCTSLAFIVFIALIVEVGPARATVITFVNPAVAVVLGIVFLHEPFTLGVSAGFVLILAGSYLATRPERARIVEAEPVSQPG